MTDPITRLNAALEGRYSIERELGEGWLRVFVEGVVIVGPHTGVSPRS